MSLLVWVLLGAGVVHPELKVSIDLPDGWRLDVVCGPFVPPAPLCRVDGALGACPTVACAERVGVIWLRAPAVLASKDDERAELLATDGGAYVSTAALEDGWVLSWGGPAWPDTFPFKVSRKLAGRVIECSGEATTVAGRQLMVEACKSVRPLK